ncbi:MAG TPA: cytochrome b N-terminal domain-containing protein [Burkholderiales bacterium]|nr:cytochrome b N-terminal domain-containing protein [Burkholderiales bacterium]
MIRRLQSAGRWVFLRMENGFNLFFGEALNPLYHLGAITFLLFWVALASGLYLYVFFRTGVNEAYDSVEALTHGQWYLGGVMRSLHRYAADGMVVTMLVHMGRYFVFNRYRGFRWFSWVTGVFLLWLTYASGINGYMLPWDRLAQFVASATAEWLDWFPVFTGSLARNFAFEGSVNDRLFSLLSFLHIGIPLGLLILMWVHTQRVPRAKINPPRRIALMLGAALLALAALKPAVSQGRADLASVAAQIGLDWLYLPLYPLIYRWSAGAAWALALGATLLLLLVPWLPPQRRRGPLREFLISFRPGDLSAVARAGETLLEAGLRQGIDLPYDCRNGGCGVCKATLERGSVDYGVYQKSSLSDAERRSGKLLLCCACAQSDVDVELEAEREWQAGVEHMVKLSPDVMLLQLRLDASAPLEYRAGQYINIVLDNGETRSFSFATAPGKSEFIELHVRLVPGGRFTTRVFTQMKPGDRLRFRGPYGSFAVQDESHRPIIFVAGATGFAPVKSMLEHAFERGMRRPTVLYWGVRSRKDLYMAELPERWAREHANFSFVPVLSDPKPEDRWTGRTGLVHQAIIEDFPTLQGYELYACGSLQMVENAHPEFIAHGLAEEACFSDAFTYSTRVAPGQGAGR